MKRVGRSMFRKIYWFPLLGIVIVMMMASMFSAVVRRHNTCPSGFPSNVSFLCILVMAYWRPVDRLLPRAAVRLDADVPRLR